MAIDEEYDDDSSISGKDNLNEEQALDVIQNFGFLQNRLFNNVGTITNPITNQVNKYLSNQRDEFNWNKYNTNTSIKFKI